MVGPLCKWVCHLELPESMMPRVYAKKLPFHPDGLKASRNPSVYYTARIQGSELVIFEPELDTGAWTGL